MFPPQKPHQIILQTYIPYNADKGWREGKAAALQRCGKPTRAVRPRSPANASAKGQGDEVPPLARQELELQHLTEARKNS